MTPTDFQARAEQLLSGLIDCECDNRSVKPCRIHKEVRKANLFHIRELLTTAYREGVEVGKKEAP